MFLRSTFSDAPTPSSRQRRGDIRSSFWNANANHRRRLMVDGDGMPVSDTATFSTLNPNTSDAEALGGGRDDMVVWGTNISLTETGHAFMEFLRNFQKKYRMLKDGDLEEEEVAGLPEGHPGSERVYVDMMKFMLDLGVSVLNLDMRNLKAYPSTQKLWYQMQNFPEEIIPIIDTVVKDVMIELAEQKMHEDRQAVLAEHNAAQAARDSGTRGSSSLPPMPSSEMDNTGFPAGGLQAALAALPNLVDDVAQRAYRVRPFGLDNTINLRELNPQGISLNDPFCSHF